MALPQLKLRVEPAELAKLADRLTELGYVESAVAELLGLWDLSQMDAKELPGYVWRCNQDGSQLARVVLLFLMGEGIPTEIAGKLLGRDNLNNLLLCGVLFRQSGALYSHVVLYPCRGHFYFTDYWVTGGQQKGQVYELGTDSYVLARITPRHQSQRALDLCTGSGVHAILSAGECSESDAVDINPRALEYTAFNAALNGVRVTTHLSDLYSEVKGRRFDLITANPPYVPSPDSEVLIHRSAGETGEEVPEALVAGLPEYLAPGGMFSMILEYPILKSEDYLDRLGRWLGEKNGWGIAVLSFGEKSVDKYIKLHMGPSEDYNAKFESYLKSYHEQGIESIDFANVFILREAHDHPNWKVKEKTFWPNRGITQQITDWLQSQSTYLNPDWRPDPEWKPNLSSYYKTLWRDWDHTRGMLEADDSNWFPGDPLNRDESELMSMMRGEKSVREIRAAWTGSEEEFMQSFRGLGLRFALV
ncbi:MAG: methyltransferase [Vulcanimicrobiota bacterium]